MQDSEKEWGFQRKVGSMEKLRLKSVRNDVRKLTIKFKIKIIIKN